MTKKKALKASKKKLKRTVKKLEVDVEAANAKAARWKKRAKLGQSDAEAAQAEVAKLQKKLKTTRNAARSVDVAPAASPVEAELLVVSPEGSTPDDSWTVTALRAEARSRGIAGYSRKSKADLLSALT